MTTFIVIKETHLAFWITYPVLPAHHSKLIFSPGLWWHPCHVFDHSIAQIHPDGLTAFRKRQLGEHFYSLLTNWAAQNKADFG